MVIIFNNKQLKWHNSIKIKLFISFFCISLLPAIIFPYIMKDTLKSHFKETEEKELLYQANKIAGNIQKENYLNDISKSNDFNLELEEKSKEYSFRILILDKKGVVVKDTNDTEIGKTYLVPEVIVALGGKDEANLREDESAIYASAYIEDKYSKKIGVVLIISSFDNVYFILEEINNKWVLLTIATIIFIGIFALFNSQVFVNPLKNILNTIQRITEGQLHQRVNIEGNDEFSEIGAAFNTMTEKLEQVKSSREEFVSNVSHELKTPLSAIKVLSDSILLQDEMPTEMYREFLQDINSEIDRMARIINDLLSLVKLDNRNDGLNIDETDINKLVSDILKRLSPLSEQKEIEVIYEENKKIIIDADEMKLSLAISNLIENGIKYTPNCGTVKVVVDADHQNAFITVQDTGIGINEEEQSKIFNRFYRVDKTRDRETGGTGLGLSITHSTILLHNGSIKVVSKEGNGATFLVRIPIKNS